MLDLRPCPYRNSVASDWTLLLRVLATPCEMMRRLAKMRDQGIEPRTR
ncbi:MAG: hypothetical protein MI923_06530 [Phycisphaerales bacterium]|nr:hypothetical protein [Phycisphaerales bacterium]